jgi:hypothetical protein
MKYGSFSFARAVWVLPLGVAIVAGGHVLSASAQQANPLADAVAATAYTTPAPVAGTPPVPATAAAGAPPSGTTSAASPGATPAAVTAPASPTAAPGDTNPFSNVKPVDNQALKQELPAIEQKLQQMQSQMSAIQQVQVALPADALNAPGHRTAAGGTGGQMDDAAMELQASTFVACVNGQAMFRDTDQKPFFVDAKEANQNESVRRIGGCKH